MNKIKLLGILVLVVLLTGCTGKYNINISKDGRVEEKFEMTFDTSIIDTKDIDRYIDDTIRQYKDNRMYTNYSFKKDTSKKKSTVYVSRRYNSLNDLINTSEILPILFEKTLFTGEQDEKGLVTTGEYYKTSVFSDDLDGSGFEKIDISVKSQLKFVSNNADKYDDETNTLYWYLNDQKNNFSINFQFNNSKRYDIIIKEFVINSIPAIIALLVIGIAVSIIYKVIKKRNNLNNEI